MKKFSVVIPTIWKGPWIVELLNRLVESEYVTQIILIDNSPELAPILPVNEKIQRIISDENLFVNPSWNLGVKLSNNENIIISNDDILFDVERYFKFLSELEDIKKYGIIGMNSDNYSLTKDTEITLTQYGTLPNTGGWACLLAFHKESWVEIPENIKIYYGDNFLHLNCSPILELRGIQVKTVMSSSANTSIDWVKKITDNDLIEWHNILGGR